MGHLYGLQVWLTSAIYFVLSEKQLKKFVNNMNIIPLTYPTGIDKGKYVITFINNFEYAVCFILKMKQVRNFNELHYNFATRHLR